MKIALDSSMLLYLLYPDAAAPIDPATGKPVTDARVRIEGLLDDLDATNSLIIIPTPVLSELLIKAETKHAEILGVLMGKRAVLVAGFDIQAAIENAALRRSAKLNRRAVSQTKNEVRFDLQVLAIARAQGAALMLTDDQNLRHRCSLVKMPVKGIADLTIPESRRQFTMALPVQIGDGSKTLSLGHDGP